MAPTPFFDSIGKTARGALWWSWGMIPKGCPWAVVSFVGIFVSVKMVDMCADGLRG